MSEFELVAEKPSYDPEQLRRDVPWHLNGKPYDVQLLSLQQSAGRRGFGHFLEQGLGKTATLLNEFVDLLLREEVEVMVVVCPDSFKADWVDAVKEWVKAPFPAMAWPEDPRGKAAKNMRHWKDPASPPFLFAINYESFRTDKGKEVIEWLTSKFKVFLCYDESSYIKNPAASTAKVAIQLSQDAPYVRLANGTPMTQGFTDIWSQYRAARIWSGTLFAQFKGMYGEKGGFMGKQLKGVKPHMLDTLRERISEHCFRAMKKDWSDLPPKTYQVRTFKPTPTQMKAYGEMFEEFLTYIGEAEIEANMIISRQMKLQQISSGFALDAERVAHELMSPHNNPKMNALIEDARACSGKFIVVTHFRYSGEMVWKRLQEEGFNMVRLQSGEDARVMKDTKDKFNTDPSIDGILLPLEVGRMGHTLLGTNERRCALTLMYENNYNLLSRLQIEDRNHRWGQDAEKVHYIDYAGTPAERDILDALARKADMAESIVNAIRAIPHRA